jgi:lysyl-tRNA synthetase class 2
LKPIRQTLIQNNLVLRSRLLTSVRRFFAIHEYLEVDTPVRIPAPAPEVHIDAQPSGTWFLQTSPELCMKQLLSAGFPRIYQICKVFRQQERGRRHLPEFTLLEWYAAGMDYGAMMEVCEDLVLHVSRELGFGEVLAYQGTSMDLGKPWDRLSVNDAFRKFAPVSMADALAGDRFDEVMGLHIEPRLGLHKPLFLYDYPAEKAALARLKPGHPDVGERFELYMAGLELCNGFSELNDPVEQRRRFEQDARIRGALKKEVYPMPEPFLVGLERMPEAAGNALGLDRLVMVFANAESIDEVVAFTPEAL